MRLEAVSVSRSLRGVTATLLDRIDWTVRAGEHWAIVGPNGAGKTTLARVASAQMRPSSGAAFVLGERLGRVPLQALRSRIGLVEPAFGRRFDPQLSALAVVCTGFDGTIAPVGAHGPSRLAQARAALALAGAGSLAPRSFASCSEGERSRVLLARALVADADLLVLDEPAGALDLAGRELLVAAFEDAVATRPGLATVTVTHHIEDLPAATSHALLLRAGRVIAAGPVARALSDQTLSSCFGLALRLERVAGRLFPHALPDARGSEATDT